MTMRIKFQLNPATGMAMGAIVAALISIVMQLTAKDSSVWSWSIPIGIAVGLPIGIAAKGKKKF
jgi:threonine/homoserine efflux transporter RhtA